MAKIPFTLEAWLKDRSQKVETGEGESVRILCTNAEGTLPIIGNVGEKSENLRRWTEKGQYHIGLNTPNEDLFIVTPEEELNGFEKKLCDVVGYAISMSVAEPKKPINEFVKDYAAELLSLAREQFIKDGYDIEKKIFHDAMEKVDPEVKKEVSENMDKRSKEELTEFEKAIEGYIKSYTGIVQTVVAAKQWAAELLDLARKQLVVEQFTSDPRKTDLYKLGKAEALKDLPRWRKVGVDTGQTNLIRGYSREEDELYRNGKCISLVSLEKLPGFKED